MEAFSFALKAFLLSSAISFSTDFLGGGGNFPNPKAEPPFNVFLAAWRKRKPLRSLAAGEGPSLDKFPVPGGGGGGRAD